ncbi:class I SAM-dependent methyltransferase [Aeromicrobium sp. NPDC092404]|uniref:class I SAM-dependent methyltransferase n=1 Tax=Aeromicrobium sp. NPDC092404 TaxID=3154976 RepID=UPI00342217DD
MTHEHALDPNDHFTREFWDVRYAGDQVWSGNPNPHLVTHASPLRAGTALEYGSGEGADAIWLAQQGWQVTAIDISPVALEGADCRAKEAGLDIRWHQADAFEWTAGPTYDLVSAQFMHLPRPAVTRLHRELAASVAPGGTLLIVGHHPDDHRHPAESSDLADMRFTAEEVAGTLDPADWQVIEATRPERDSIDRDGRPAVAVDAVLRAVRRA